MVRSGFGSGNETFPRSDPELLVPDPQHWPKHRKKINTAAGKK